MAKSWAELGKRVLEARKDVGYTQDELATELRMERTAVTKIEKGERKVDSLELARLADVLHRPISWFIAEPPASVVSRRAERDVIRREDIQLESLVQDVEQLIELGVLQPVAPPLPVPSPLPSIDATEAIALDARRAADLGAHDPIWDLVKVVEKLGLYAFVLPLDTRTGADVDGSYVALPNGGVALVGSAGGSGRRRFTIAHELGHHILADEYAPEWIVGSGDDEREKVINAFAIHFLLPRSAVEQRWTQLRGAADPRDAAIRIAIEFGLSWSAVCAQLERFGCLTNEQYEHVLERKPTRLDHVERELSIRDDVSAPRVPPMYAAAVARALRKGRLGPRRALELLHGTVHERDLPAERAISIESMTAELEPLPR